MTAIVQIRRVTVRGCRPLSGLSAVRREGNDGNPCGELAVAPGTVDVRDSKNLEGPRLAITPCAWADFLPYLATNWVRIAWTS
ncbi:DUF397 domain-containing protein [Streptomyces paradoxus]|uniref:DUF397 domain-containing protein n=1 Tax=Streptomyces paradoxus TaxID=66375 RepID=UPI00382BE1B0